jgi:hypothetical protein
MAKKDPSTRAIRKRKRPMQIKKEGWALEQVAVSSMRGVVRGKKETFIAFANFATLSKDRERRILRADPHSYRALTESAR